MQDDRPDAESTFRLLERARAGDEAATNQLFARHVRPLQRWASGRLPKWARDVTDTDDLVQETLLQTFKRIGAVRAPRRRRAASVSASGGPESDPRGAAPEGAAARSDRPERRSKPTATCRRSSRRSASEAIERYETALARLRPGGAGRDHRPHRAGLHLRGAGRGARQADGRCRSQGRAAGPGATRRGDEAWQRMTNGSNSSLAAVLDGSAIDWNAAESTRTPARLRPRPASESRRRRCRRSPHAGSRGDTSGFSSASAVARSATSTARGIRGSIARSR